MPWLAKSSALHLPGSNNKSIPATLTEMAIIVKNPFHDFK
jgi:hypothetical protein